MSMVYFVYTYMLIGECKLNYFNKRYIIFNVCINQYNLIYIFIYLHINIY